MYPSCSPGAWLSIQSAKCNLSFYERQSAHSLKTSCEIRNSESKFVATGHREGYLYYVPWSWRSNPSSLYQLWWEQIQEHHLASQVWIFKCSRNARQKWLKDWILIHIKWLVSVSPVFRGRATSCFSNSQVKKEQILKLNWYTVMCMKRLKHHH